MLFDVNFQYELQREVHNQRMREADKERLLRLLPRRNGGAPGRWLRLFQFFL